MIQRQYSFIINKINVMTVDKILTGDTVRCGNPCCTCQVWFGSSYLCYVLCDAGRGRDRDRDRENDENERNRMGNSDRGFERGRGRGQGGRGKLTASLCRVMHLNIT